MTTFWATLYQRQGAGYERKFESTSNRCCHVANDFTNFTVHTGRCVRRAGEPITHTYCGGGIIWQRAVFISVVAAALSSIKGPARTAWGSSIVLRESIHFSRRYTPKTTFIFRPSPGHLELWPFGLKIALPVTSDMSYNLSSKFKRRTS